MQTARLRTALVSAAALIAVFASTRSTDAQLFPSGDGVITMGHVLLNVSDVSAHRDFWTKQFDARPVTIGKLEGVTIPGVVVLFRLQPPAGPSEGTTINHMGLKLNKLADFTALRPGRPDVRSAAHRPRENAPDLRDRSRRIPHGAR